MAWRLLNLFLNSTFNFRDVLFLDDLVRVRDRLHSLPDGAIAGSNVAKHDIWQASPKYLDFVMTRERIRVVLVVWVVWVVPVLVRIDSVLDVPSADRDVGKIPENFHVVMNLYAQKPFLHVVRKFHHQRLRFGAQRRIGYRKVIVIVHILIESPGVGVHALNQGRFSGVFDADKDAAHTRISPSIETPPSCTQFFQPQGR